MSFVDLSTVQQRVAAGIPLPFDVYDADETLLLARGQIIETQAQLDQLLQRGARVGLADATPSLHSVRGARPEQLPALLRTAVALACETLARAPHDGYEAVVDAVAEPLMAIIEADPDLAIFQIIRQEGNYLTQYGVTHAIHCAFTSFLIATRLGWQESDLRRAFNAALTMNVSMFELQGQLATQSHPMTGPQRELVDTHPRRSAVMLETVGISDAEWLAAIRQHHDAEPSPQSSPRANELASLLRSADTYTAKLSPRRSREALCADVAARLMFAANRGDPATAALVKEFGLYPPGCHVRLACGETGYVVRRGELAHIPWVAVTNDAEGRPLPEPVRRNTAQPAYKVAAVMPTATARMRFSTETMQRIAWSTTTG